jgi:hypothetical protein
MEIDNTHTYKSFMENFSHFEADENDDGANLGSTRIMKSRFVLSMFV